MLCFTSISVYCWLGLTENEISCFGSQSRYLNLWDRSLFFQWLCIKIHWKNTQETYKVVSRWRNRARQGQTRKLLFTKYLLFLIFEPSKYVYSKSNLKNKWRWLHCGNPKNTPLEKMNKLPECDGNSYLQPGIKFPGTESHKDSESGTSWEQNLSRRKLQKTLFFTTNKL